MVEQTDVLVVGAGLAGLACALGCTARGLGVIVAEASDRAGGLATVATGSTRSLTVDTRNLPAPAPQSFYEVWLLDPATQKMLPMGVPSPSGRGEYAVSSAIMGGYSAVDVSLQANDGDPAHSQTSVLRAYLQA